MTNSHIRTVIEFHGMMRSGVHAILMWLQTQFLLEGLGTLHLNDVLSDYAIRENSQKHRLIPEDTEVVLYNIEDWPVHSALTELSTLHMYAPLHGVSAQHVMVLRDPLNLFASRARYCGDLRLGRFTDRALRCWLGHARRFLSEKPGWTYISYNDWVRFEQYRRKISEKFGTTFTDAAKDLMPVFGGGSSFTGFSMNGRASEMAVLGRYKAYMHQAWFRSLWTHDIASAAVQVFPSDTYLVDEFEALGLL